MRERLKRLLLAEVVGEGETRGGRAVESPT